MRQQENETSRKWDIKKTGHQENETARKQDSKKAGHQEKGSKGAKESSGNVQKIGHEIRKRKCKCTQ